MRIAPRNELELIFRFAQEMPKDWELLRLQWDFPDATLRIDGEIYRAEFEHKSKNFIRHEHDLMQVDLIICWIHDWGGCPLPVLEVRKPDWADTRLFKVSKQEKEGGAAEIALKQAKWPIKKLESALTNLAIAEKEKTQTARDAEREKARAARNVTKAYKKLQDAERRVRQRAEREADVWRIGRKRNKNVTTIAPAGPIPIGTLISHCDYPDFRGIVRVGGIQVMDGWCGSIMPNYPVTIPQNKLVWLT